MSFLNPSRFSMKSPQQLVVFMRYIPVLLFFLFIIWIIVMADNGTKSVFFDFVRSMPYGDKLGHVGLYGTLAALLNMALAFRSVQVKICKPVSCDLQLNLSQLHCN